MITYISIVVAVFGTFLLVMLSIMAVVEMKRYLND